MDQGPEVPPTEINEFDRVVENVKQEARAMRAAQGRGFIGNLRYVGRYFRGEIK